MIVLLYFILDLLPHRDSSLLWLWLLYLKTHQELRVCEKCIMSLPCIKVSINGADVKHVLAVQLDFLSVVLRPSIFDIGEDCLGIVEIEVCIVAVLWRVALAVLLVEVSDQLVLHFFVNQVNRDGFFQGFFEFFWLVFDKVVLLLGFFLNVLHVWLDLINILYLLLGRWLLYRLKHLLNLIVLLL